MDALLLCDKFTMKLIEQKSFNVGISRKHKSIQALILIKKLNNGHTQYKEAVCAVRFCSHSYPRHLRKRIDSFDSFIHSISESVESQSPAEQSYPLGPFDDMG